MAYIEDDPISRLKRRRLEKPKLNEDVTWISNKGWQPAETVFESDSAVANVSTELSSCIDIKDCTESVDEGTVVCFGMIIDLPVVLPSHTVDLRTPARRPVYLDPDDRVYHCSDGNLIGTLDAHAAEALSKLETDGQIGLQLCYSISTETRLNRRGKASGLLEVILYGPKGRADDVGDFVAKCGHYLQEPLGCDRNVPYCNPHCLSSLDGSLPMTFHLREEQPPVLQKLIRQTKDVLAHFETSEALKETDTPSTLRTQLQAHQRQALTFLLRRERTGAGVWVKETNFAGAAIYVNTVSGERQLERPPAWRGGILADEMGLGKTLSMIALVVAGKATNKDDRHSQHGNSLSSTLIVVPPNVLSEWEAQIERHSVPNKITWFRHHGASRFKPTVITKTPDIVLTTYQTVESEQRKGQLGNDSILSLHWNRIILDEAHVIRNCSTATAKVTASLHATYRWAISGTPIQNSLTDFLGLLKFLRFHPYDNTQKFDDDLSEPWRNGNFEEAVEKFKRLLSCIMIRRLKNSTVELPPRDDQIIRVPFSPEEKAYYRKIEQPVVELLDDASKTRYGTGGVWLNAIQQIQRLRLACNLGVGKRSSHPTRTRSNIMGGDMTLEVLGARLSMGAIFCEHCLQAVNVSEADAFSDGLTVSPTVYYTSCLRTFCSSCANILHFDFAGPCACGPRATPCTLRPLLWSQLTPRLTSNESSMSPEPSEYQTKQVSSKVKTVVSNIQANPAEKSVVFSFWTSSLDVVQHALEVAGIRCVRVDGNVSLNNRKRALKLLGDDPETKAILLTISCGAIGIDLTAASRVYLLEPQWNPSLEDQALARVHRVGQTRPVTTIRCVMEDSIEERIINIQDRKKLLASLLLSNESSSQVSRGCLYPFCTRVRQITDIFLFSNCDPWSEECESSE
ncbi:hypothetical protein EV356DRAFT_445723 [Viridothelium virens]|uniref:Uncharacterized protein n=1 Tax=Viridothelium virens TaxID=1048519 RepID=A0A6A6HB78_VIRVR|nr:hypothetical protein EV356DRAFT_445723 [Viridothelium virens]